MKNIVFEQVTKRFGGNVIVKDLDLEVREGERLILLGPSGCGKSTTLRMIAGLEPVTDGKLYMGGRCVNEVSCGDRGVSMVFQNYALYPHMTVRQNITYGLRAHRLPAAEIEERLSEAVEMLELAGLEDRKPRELSGGQRQRVALARAVVKRSEYFLLDEPLSNLDAQLRLRARKELVRIHERYRQTLVYVTHDQIEAMTVGNRIALMHGGKMEMLDTPPHVYNRPATVFCARFIGSPSMNIVEAEYHDGKLCIGSQQAALAPMWRSLIEQSGKTKLFAGLRPEHVRIGYEKTPRSIEGTVRYVEDYGNRFGAYIEIPGDRNELIAVMEKNVPRPDERVFVEADPFSLHLFDRETERSLGYPEEVIAEQEKQALPEAMTAA